MVLYCQFLMHANATIDVNLSELEYLAAHLSEEDCRQLIAALHIQSYQLQPQILEETGKMPPFSSLIPSIFYLLLCTLYKQ